MEIFEVEPGRTGVVIGADERHTVIVCAGPVRFPDDTGAIVQGWESGSSTGCAVMALVPGGSDEVARAALLQLGWKLPVPSHVALGDGAGVYRCPKH